MPKSGKQTRSSIKLSWKKAGGAVSYIIYGGRCGKSGKMKQLATGKGTSATVKKIAGKKLAKGTYYKFLVLTLDQNKNVVSASKVIHVATKGGKSGNISGLKLTGLKKARKTIKSGKTYKIKVSQTKGSKIKVKKHTGLRYETSNATVATVTKAGKVKGVKKGNCKIYVCGQNGLVKTLKLTVKR